MSLIESLTGSTAIRPDDKRILPRRRPLFVRTRDVFDVLVALRTEATMVSFIRSIDLKQAEPRTLTQVVLSRWPTEDELAALPQPYHPQTHLRDMLAGREFRASLFRRICEAYPERQRLLCVRIPRCAGGHFAAMASTMHPIFPNDLAIYRNGDVNRFIPALGAFVGRFTLTRTLLLIQPTLAPFVQAPIPARANPRFAETGLDWILNAPPRRTGDRLFAILREPGSLILSQVNSVLDALMQPAASDTAYIAALRARLPANLANSDPAGLKHIARDILRTLPLRNPICHALADGTASGALSAARHHDIELTDLTRYPDWVKYTWDVEPDVTEIPTTPHLRRTDLTLEDTAHLEQRIGEDQIFYRSFNQALSQLGELRHSVRGRDL